ncbi:MAG: universal stress protein [Thermoplasmatota archaeon]
MRLVVGLSEMASSAAETDLLSALAGGERIDLLHAGATRPDSLDTTCEALTARGAHAETHLVAGVDPARALSAAAASSRADLVVVGSGWHHGASGWGFVSDPAWRVARSVDASVLLLRSTPGGTSRRILLASGRPGGLFLPMAARVASATNSPVSAVHVVPAPSHEGVESYHLDDPKTQGSPAVLLHDALASTVRELGELGASVSPIVRRGPVEEELVREASGGEYWLLALRSRRPHPLDRIIFGPAFAEDMMRHVNTSVLIVRT